VAVDVAVLEDPRVAAVALEPTRARLLAELVTAPASAGRSTGAATAA
jgi:hypothetical protein